MAELTEQQKNEPVVPSSLKALIEALIFAAREPLSAQQIKSIYQGENRNSESRQIETETIRQSINDLNKEYAKHDRPYRIIPIAGGYQFSTPTEYADWIGRLHKEQGRRKLSQSGIESLAIIAYKQPITKSEVESIRGVNCDYVLKTLLEKELVSVTGRAETVGRPLLYGTTREFLKYFGLNEITDLPRPREIEEILGESQFETERRMLEAQQGVEQMKKEQEDFKSRLPHIPKRKSGLDQKDVEIVPRTKTREIKVLADEVRKTAEQAGQESMPFPSTSEVPKPVTVEGTISVPPDSIEAVGPPVESLFEGAADIPDTPVVEVSEKADIPMAGFQTEATPEHKPVAADATTPGATTRTRWQSWREKVTGFIRKIFG